MLQNQIEHFILNTDHNSQRWSQVYVQRDTLLLVAIEDRMGDERDIQSFGHAFLVQCIDVMSSHQPIDEMISQLEQCMAQFRAKYDPVILSVVAGIVDGEKIRSWCFGKSGAYLFRNGKLGALFGTRQNVAGVLKAHDFLFFFTPALLDVFPPKVLRSMIKETGEETAEMMEALLQSQNITGGSGCILSVRSDRRSLKQAAKKQLHLWDSLQSFIRRFLSLGRTFIKKFFYRFLRREFYVSHKKRIFWGFVVCILFVFFSVNMYRQFETQRQSKQYQQFQLIEERLRHDLSEAQNLVGLNDARALTLAADVKNKLQPFITVFPQGSTEYRMIAELQRQVEDVYSSSSRVYTVSDVQRFFDMSIVKPEAMVNQLTIFDGILYALDAKNAAIFTVNLQTKRGDIFGANSKIVNARVITANSDAAYVLGVDGVFKVKRGSKESVNILPPGESSGGIADLRAFSGNVYAVDAAQNEIIKYVVAEDGMTQRYVWLPGDSSHRFAPQTQLAIDGSIWTITAGTINKFTQGRIDTAFSVQGLDNGFSSTALFYTDDKSQRLYVLDRGRDRLVILSKSGEYMGQYQWKSIHEMTSFVVYEQQKKALLCNKSIIYAIDIK